MSGDVQPRKRKEKRRKKEDEDTGTPPPTLINPAEHASDNVTIHIYKEGSTGGHWCARIIFFALFTVLIGLVGVIIFEHRGTTDVDTPIASSQWAVIFEGWVDDAFPFYNDGEHEKHDDNPSHEVEHDEEDEHEEGDSEHEDEEEDESGGTEDGDKEEDDTEEDNVSNRVEEEEEEEEGEGDEEEAEDEDEEAEENYHNDETEEDEGDSDQQNDMDEEDEEAESKVESDEGFAEEDDMGVLDEVDESKDEDEEQDDDNDDEEDITNISEPDLDVSIEGIKPFTKMDDDDVYEYVSIPGVNDIDDSIEPLEEVEEEESEEIINEVEIEPLEDEVKEEEEETSVAVKFGVGVALVVAAHFVLVRRWKNVDDAQPYDVDLTRRNTIIPPPNPKQFNATGGIAQKQQLKNFQMFEFKYKNLPAEEMPLNKQPELVETLKNILKKEQVNDPAMHKKDEQEIYTSESERYSGTEQESDYDEEDLEDEEDFEEEEEEDEEEGEELEDEVGEEVDDHELVAKLEAKYGKLPTPSQSEEELDDEEEEDEEMEDEEEADVGDWKRLNAPQSVHSSVENPKPKNKNAKEVPNTSQTSSRGGRQEFDLFDSVDHNDVNIQEEIEHWLARDLDN